MGENSHCLHWPHLEIPLGLIYWIVIFFRCIQPEVLGRQGVIQVIVRRRLYGADHLSLEATGFIDDLSITFAINVT